jgi:hypothetical protein
MNKLENACCMACIHWRYTQQGTGECMNLKIYTREEFGCKAFVDGEYKSN